MECNAIKDLMQLYVDDLCSDESKKMVEEHVSTCSSCKAYLEKLKTQQNREKELDEKYDKELDKNKEKASKAQLKPFRKLRKTLLARCIFDVVAVILFIAAIVAVIPLLSGVSFGLERIYYYQEEKNAKILINYLVDGKSAEFVDLLEYPCSLFDNVEGGDAWRESCIESVDNLYSDYFEGQDVKVKITSSAVSVDGQDTFGSEQKCTITVNGNQFIMYVSTTTDGGMMLDNITLVGEDESNPVSSQYLMPLYKTLYSKSYGTGDQLTYALSYLGNPNNADKISLYESEYSHALSERLCALPDSGVSITDCYSSGLYYDETVDDVCATIVIEFSDSEGHTAIIKKNVHIPSLEPVDDEVLIIDDGINTELKEKLEQLF